MYKLPFFLLQMKRCHNFSLQMKSGTVPSFCTTQVLRDETRRSSAVDRMLTRIPIEMHSVCTRAASDLLPLICESKLPFDRYIMLCSGGSIPKVGRFTELSPCTSRSIPIEFPKQSTAKARQDLSIDRHRLSVVQIYNLIDRTLRST